MAAIPATYTAGDVSEAVARLQEARERAAGPACATCGARESMNVREAEAHLVRVAEAVFGAYGRAARS